MNRTPWIGAGARLMLALGATATNATLVWQAGDVIVRGGASAVAPDE